MNFYFALLLSFLFLGIMDITWISFNYQYYMNLLKKIQKEPFVVKINAILLAYISIFVSYYLFVKLISIEGNTVLYAFLFGIAVYGTFSYTTCTYFKNYNYYHAFKDMMWGIILYLVSGILFNYLYKNKFII
jgi:uncharacterized membrane protein